MMGRIIFERGMHVAEWNDDGGEEVCDRAGLRGFFVLGIITEFRS